MYFKYYNSWSAVSSQIKVWEMLIAIFYVLWLSSKGPNYQREISLISAGAIEGHFEGKTPSSKKVTKGVFFLHDNAPAHWALATQKKLAYLGFQCLDHPPYSPDLAPSDYHLFPGLKKNN